MRAIVYCGPISPSPCYWQQNVDIHLIKTLVVIVAEYQLGIAVLLIEVEVNTIVQNLNMNC